MTIDSLNPPIDVINLPDHLVSGFDTALTFIKLQEESEEQSIQVSRDILALNLAFSYNQLNCTRRSITFKHSLQATHLDCSLSITMAQNLSTPRILPKNLESFGPSSGYGAVRMLGTITAIHGSQATLTTADGDTVTLVMNRDSHLKPQSIFDVVGKVSNLEGGAGLGLKVLSATEWPRSPDGKPVDLKVYEAVVEANHKYKSIFYANDTE